MTKIGSMSIFRQGVAMPKLWNGNTVFNVEEIADSDRSGNMTKSYKVSLFHFDSNCVVRSDFELFRIFGIPEWIDAKSREEAEVLAQKLFNKFKSILDLVKKDYKDFE